MDCNPVSAHSIADTGHLASALSTAHPRSSIISVIQQCIFSVGWEHSRVTCSARTVKRFHTYCWHIFYYRWSLVTFSILRLNFAVRSHFMLSALRCFFFFDSLQKYLRMHLSAKILPQNPCCCSSGYSYSDSCLQKLQLPCSREILKTDPGFSKTVRDQRVHKHSFVSYFEPNEPMSSTRQIVWRICNLFMSLFFGLASYVQASNFSQRQFNRRTVGYFGSP